METILYTVMFLFPGAAVHVFYRLLAPSRYHDSRKHETLRLAGYFIASSIIVSISSLLFVLVFEPGVDGVIMLFEKVIEGWGPAVFLGVSFGVSLLAALLWRHVIDRYLYREKQHTTVKLPYHSVWESIVSEIDDWKDTYVVIMKDDSIVRCGTSQTILPNVWEEDEAIALAWSDWMTDWFRTAIKKPERNPAIGHLVYEYFMIGTGYSIRLYQSAELTAYFERATSSSSAATKAVSATAAGLSA